MGFVIVTPIAADSCMADVNVVVKDAPADTEYDIYIHLSPSGNSAKAGELTTNKHGKGTVNFKIDLCRFDTDGDGMVSIRVAVGTPCHGITPIDGLMLELK